MKPSQRIPMQLASRVASSAFKTRPIHSTAVSAAKVAPIVGTGPPPQAPVPEVASVNERVNERIARRRRQAELLKTAKQIRTRQDTKNTPLQRRFWKTVDVQVVDDALQIHLDARPLRHPQTKDIVRLPKTKQTLATAIALEWDLMTSAQHAMKQHLIPLTSLACRALDIEKDDAAHSQREDAPIRNAITSVVLKYFDTDSLLCWAPPAGTYDLLNDAGESLRDVQKKVAEETVSYLTTHVWPGIVIKPVLDGHSIVPRQQSEGVREVIQGWIMGLSAWEIAGLERAVLAGKSLVTAARFIAEWSDGPAGLGRATGQASRFGIEDAARATSLEVDWQAKQWGEVEDTHDVNNEDVRRQLGSVVLLVSGNK